MSSPARGCGNQSGTRKAGRRWRRRQADRTGSAPAYARTALAALGTLERGPDAWEALARSNPRVPTTLGALEPSVTADLLEHAWVLAVVNVYVVLGHGEGVIRNLAALANRERFEALCA